MKKYIIIALSFLTLIIMGSSQVYATTSEALNGNISLTDVTGGGPGALNIAVSRNSYVQYSGTGATTAYGGGVDGQVMSVSSISGKAAPAQRLQFLVRASEDPAFADDNNVYQLPVTSGTVSSVTIPTAITGYFVRGGSI